MRDHAAAFGARRVGGAMSRLRDVPKRCFPLAFFPILLHPPAPDDVARLWLGRECPEEERSGGASFREVISLCSEGLALFLTGQRAVMQVVFAVYNRLLIRTRNTNYYSNLPGKTRCPFKAWTRLGEGRRRRGGRHRDPAFARRGLDGLGAAGQEGGKVRALRTRKRLQDIVRGRLSTNGASDAESDPEIIAGSDRRADALQAVVPTVTSTLLDAKSGEVDVEFVVHDEESLGWDPVEIHSSLDRPAAFVHVGQWSAGDD